MQVKCEGESCMSLGIVQKGALFSFAFYSENTVLTEKWNTEQLTMLHLVKVFAWYDNQSCMLYIAKNPIFHARTKHIEVQYHYV